LAEGNQADLQELAGRVIDLLDPELASDGFELLDVRIFRGGGRVQLRIYVDLADGGISLGQVATASRTVGMLLEEADLFAGQYVIEVSSPGIRRPLRTLAQYEGAVGHKVDLKVGGGPRLRGLLEEIEGQTLVIRTVAKTVETGDADHDESGEKEIVRMDLDRILEGNLDPEFDAQALINADRRRRKEARRSKRRAKAGGKKSRPKAGKKPKNQDPPVDSGTSEDS
jgi:ribosome maturation factor RimP